jgi:hypothetical protein
MSNCPIGARYHMAATPVTTSVCGVANMKKSYEYQIYFTWGICAKKRKYTHEIVSEKWYHRS